MTPATIWITGLPSAGKTTLANALATSIRASGNAVVVLDGDEVRRSLSKDLGFNEASRRENVRRCGAVAELVTRSGVFSVVALISPSAAARAEVRAAHVQQGLRFFEVYLSAPLSVCEARDAKGLYAKARAGLAKEVTGIDSPFDVPLDAELDVPADQSVAEAVLALVKMLD